MKKYFFTCLFLAVLFSGCKQKNDKGFMQEKAPKNFVKTVEGVSFKMIRVEKVKKTTLGKGAGAKERVVSLSEFYIAETEVTQELWQAIMEHNPSYFDGNGGNKVAQEGDIQEKRPVESVSWYEAALFCNKLTEKLIGKDECVYTFMDVQEEEGKINYAKVTWDFSKKGFRLPTEAEFEYAARGGDADAVFAGGDYRITDPTGEAHALPPLKKVAWFNKNADSKTHQVAKKEPNGYGIYDMSGNVFEWCNDYYVKPLPENVEKDPQGPDEDSGLHTCKGGGYGVGGYSQCTVTARNANTSISRLDDVGLRVVCRLYE